ncbi:hypothetical protein A2U01_0094441, partial [Trifolium medium]|nr:hypothetical protein [Trifolium medium]
VIDTSFAHFASGGLNCVEGLIIVGKR